MEMLSEAPLFPCLWLLQGLFRSMESFQKKAWRIACQTHPHSHCLHLFHIGHKDGPQSHSESIGISQCDFDLPQVWFASSCWGHMLSSASCVA